MAEKVQLFMVRKWEKRNLTPKPAPPPQGRLRGFGYTVRMKRNRLKSGGNLQVFFWDQAETFQAFKYSLFLSSHNLVFGLWALVGDLSLEGRKRRIKQSKVKLTLCSSLGE